MLQNFDTKVAFPDVQTNSLGKIMGCVYYIEPEWPLFWLEKDIVLVWFEAPRYRRTNSFQENLNLICDETRGSIFPQVLLWCLSPRGRGCRSGGLSLHRLPQQLSWRWGSAPRSCSGLVGWWVGGPPCKFLGGIFFGLREWGNENRYGSLYISYIRVEHFHHFSLLKSVWLLSPYSFHIIYALIPWIFDSGITQQQRTWEFAVDQLEKWQVGWRTSVAYLQGHLQPQLAIYFFGHWNGANFIFF